MSMDWIRLAYGVPAKRGGRVRYTGEKDAKSGTITSARGAHLRIRMDGEKRAGLYHPTFQMEYL